MKKTVNLAHARTSFQREVMERIQQDKVCPFCREHFLEYHTRPIITEGKHWILTENFQPYEGSKCHLLAVSLTHVEHFEDLPPKAQVELFSLFSEELKRREITGGTMFMRFGDTDYTSGTVEHLHAHLVSGAKRSDDREPLVTYIGYKQ